MKCRPLPGSDEYELLEDLEFDDGYVVRAGFRWNGASIPRVAWTLLGYTPWHPRLMRGSCRHDDEYGRQVGVRREADDTFRAVIIADGVSERDARRMHAAVRQFGVGVWMDDEDRAEQARREQRERERAEQAP